MYKNVIQMIVHDVNLANIKTKPSAITEFETSPGKNRLAEYKKARVRRRNEVRNGAFGLLFCTAAAMAVFGVFLETGNGHSRFARQANDYETIIWKNKETGYEKLDILRYFAEIKSLIAGH